MHHGIILDHEVVLPTQQWVVQPSLKALRNSTTIMIGSKKDEVDSG
jgi:hypothetical protein